MADFHKFVFHHFFSLLSFTIDNCFFTLTDFTPLRIRTWIVYVKKHYRSNGGRMLAENNGNDNNDDDNSSDTKHSGATFYIINCKL